MDRNYINGVLRRRVVEIIELKSVDTFCGVDLKSWNTLFKVDTKTGTVYSVKSLRGVECNLRSVGTFQENYNAIVLYVNAEKEIGLKTHVKLHELIHFYHTGTVLEHAEIIHINGNKLDNRIENLKQVLPKRCVFKKSFKDGYAFSYDYGICSLKPLEVSGFSNMNDAVIAIQSISEAQTKLEEVYCEG